MERKPKDDSPGLSTRRLIDASNNTTGMMDAKDVPGIPEVYHNTYKMADLMPKRDDALKYPADRELQEIDNMGTSRGSNDSDELVAGCAPDVDVIKQRGRRVLRNLAARSVTPNSSQVNMV